MKIKFTKTICLFLSWVLFVFPLFGVSPKPIVLNPDYDHDHWKTEPRDVMRFFEAYTVSFDGDDDDDGDGIPDLRRVPEWVSYEIHTYPGKLPHFKRPASWFTDETLFRLGIAPEDAAYAFGKTFRENFPSSDELGYDRGHMCMKQIASRLGEAADWNTHTVLNACPQKHDFNAGIWLDLELRTEHWADAYGKIWVICGPFFEGKKVSHWLGEEGELKVAIPDGFFKIVVRESGACLAFLYSQTDTNKGPYQQERHLVSVKAVEEKTGLRFFARMAEPERSERILARPQVLWP